MCLIRINIKIMFLDYKLKCFDDKFSKSFKLYLGQDAVYNFINSMDKESRYWDEVKNILIKNLR